MKEPEPVNNPHPNINDYPNAQDYIRAWAEWLVDEAYDLDVIVTIGRVPGPGPFAMRNFTHQIDVREMR